MVGKVTVKMLERNLCRLYNQYHKPGAKKSEPWELGRAHFIVSAYTAVVATAALAVSLTFMTKKK